MSKAEAARVAEVVDGYLRYRLGVDPDRDEEALCALATTGYVASCWRNTVLEAIHSGGFVRNARVGSYARDGIPDTDMARLNIVTWRQVRPHVATNEIDVIAVRELLRDQNRPLAIGHRQATAGELFAGVWTKLCWHLNEGAWLPLHVASAFDEDDSAVVRYYAACGGGYADDWFGHPWWETAIRAWAAEVPPNRPGDLTLALEAPNLLDEQGISWLIGAKYNKTFRAAIRTWQKDRGADDEKAPREIFFPPAVPNFPPSMRRQR